MKAKHTICAQSRPIAHPLRLENPASAISGGTSGKQQARQANPSANQRRFIFEFSMCWACYKLKSLEEQGMASTFSIGEAARRAGCTVATIRFYEEAGLVAEIARGKGGRRVFSRADVERLRLIRRLRALELDLPSIGRLLSAMRNAGTCANVRELAAAQLEIVRARRVEIDALERTLEEIAGRCATACVDQIAPGCGIIEELAR